MTTQTDVALVEEFIRCARVGFTLTLPGINEYIYHVEDNCYACIVGAAVVGHYKYTEISLRLASNMGAELLPNCTLPNDLLPVGVRLSETHIDIYGNPTLLVALTRINDKAGGREAALSWLETVALPYIKEHVDE